MPSITIDGREVEAQEGQTILEAIRASGGHVPTLCYHPRLGQAGLCRLCVVEVEGARALVTSCNNTVSEGMVVKTASPPVLEARRMIVELLLADGEHDCLTCEMAGSCELQQAAYELGIKERTFDRIVDHIDLDWSHPMIVRDPNKCINCFRCIRACNEVVVNRVLEMGYRGARSLVIADQDVPLGESSCVSCGECVQVCPTGALVERKAIGMGRVWDLEKVKTTCPYCGVGCQMEVHVDKKANRIVKVTAVEDGVPNKGSLCVKGRFAYDYLTSVHVPVSWDEALDYTADRLREIVDEYGPDSVAAVCSAKDTNENNYAMMKFIRGAIGTNNLDHCARN